MDFLSKITDSLDNHPFLQCVWFVFGVCIMVPVAFAYDTAMVCRVIGKIVVEDWRELREFQRARRPDDDDDDLPNYFAPVS